MRFDLAIVGAGIIGLAGALAAARRGLKVVVIERDAQANGASIRNFGLVVVSGQQSGLSRRRAERTRSVWLELEKQAGLTVIHRGKLVVAQRPEAMAVLDAYARTQEGQDCRMLTADEVCAAQPGLNRPRIAGGMHSPSELRVESREALPKIAAFLAREHGVDFRYGVAVTEATGPVLKTSQGDIRARKILVCPGDDLATLYPGRIAAYAVQRCKLQMLRLADPGFRLSGAVVSDLSLLRYGGYAAMPEAAALRSRLDGECRIEIANGVHLIVAQSTDGSLVVGDSHHYGQTPDPFGSQSVDALILGEFAALFGQTPEVTARWVGTYSSANQEAFIDAPSEDVRVAMVTSGTGASTGFAIGEEAVEELFPA